MTRKIIFISLILFELTFVLTAQPLKTKHIGVPIDGFENNTYQRKNGNYFICTSISTSDLGHSYVSIYDFQKDSVDVISANKLPYGHFGFSLTTAVETSDNGILIGGGVDSLLGPGNFFNTIFYKLDSTFNLQWSKIISNPIGLTGRVNSTCKLPDNGFLFNNYIRTDSLGDILWMRYNQTLQHVVFPGFSNRIISANGNKVSEYDSLLNGIWTKSYGNISIHSGIKTVDNEYAFCGIHDSATFRAIFFLKTDSVGNVLSFKNSSYSNWTDTMEMIQLPDKSFEILTQLNNSIFLIHLDTLSNIKYSGYWPGSNFNSFFYAKKLFNKSDSVFTIASDMLWPNYYSLQVVFIDVTINDSSHCNFNSFVISWDDNLVSGVNEPVYTSFPINYNIINFNIITGIDFNSRGVWDLCYVQNSIPDLLVDERINVFPVPVQKEIFISSDVELRNTTVKIYDQFGKVLFQKGFDSLIAEKIEINFSNGVYYISIVDDITIKVKKFIVSN